MVRKPFLLAAAAALLLSGRARAVSPAALVSCFTALSGPGEDDRPLSAGRGQDLANWEWAPPRSYTSIAVAERRGGREGFYLYGDGGRAEYYHFDTPKIPAEERSGSYRSIPLEIRPEGTGRGYFHCVYRATDAPGRLDCDVTDREPKYYAPARQELTGSDADWSALKTAVVERIMSVHGIFQRRASAYGDALATWRRRNAEPSPAWATLAGYAGLNPGWYFARPSEPPRDAARKALAACGAVDDEYVGSAARTEARLLEAVALPRP
jgi:hypothetical protein